MTAPSTTPEAIAALLDTSTGAIARRAAHLRHCNPANPDAPVIEALAAERDAALAENIELQTLVTVLKEMAERGLSQSEWLVVQLQAARAEVARMRDALRSIVDLGGACGSDKYADAADHIARAALTPAPGGAI